MSKSTIPVVKSNCGHSNEINLVKKLLTMKTLNIVGQQRCWDNVNMVLIYILLILIWSAIDCISGNCPFIYNATISIWIFTFKGHSLSHPNINKCDLKKIMLEFNLLYLLIKSLLSNLPRSGFKTSSKAHWRRYTKSSKCSHITPPVRGRRLKHVEI